MNKYRDKSDFEINKAVAEITIYGDWYLSPTDERPFTFFNYGINSSKTVELPDYCNNPSDAMPIIFENGISLIKEDDHYIAASTDVGVEWYIGAPELMLYGLGWLSKDKNPYRAAMEVFLMMKDAENEKI